MRLILTLQSDFLSLGCSFLTFDDITISMNGDVHNGYGGLNWEKASVFNTGLWGNYSIALISGSYNAYNLDGGDMLINANTTSSFSFYSFYAASPHNVSSVMTMTGSRSGTVLYNTTITLNKYYCKYFELNWLDIDRLHFRTIVYIAFDNMCIAVD